MSVGVSAVSRPKGSKCFFATVFPFETRHVPSFRDTTRSKNDEFFRDKGVFRDWRERIRVFVVILELCKGVHCVDLGEGFQTHIYLQTFASIQPRTSPVKFAASRDTIRGCGALRSSSALRTASRTARAGSHPERAEP